MIKNQQFSVLNWELIAGQLADQSYAAVDDFMSKEQIAVFYQLAKDYYEAGMFRRAGVGRGDNYQKKENLRGDQIYWLSSETNEPLIQNFWADIDRLIQYLNHTCFLGLKSSEFHFAIYPPGKEYKRHLDVFKDSDARKISVITYLNPVWEPEWGGELRLFLPEGEKDILPKGGRMVCMRSELLEHAVLPVKKERFSLTGWLKTSDVLIF